jgi:hypothetical protein
MFQVEILFNIAQNLNFFDMHSPSLVEMQSF